MAQINRRASAVRRAGYPAPETFEPQQQFQPPPQMDFEPPKPEPFDPTEAFDFYKSKVVHEPLFWDEARRDPTTIDKDSPHYNPKYPSSGFKAGGTGWVPKTEENWASGIFSPRKWVGDRGDLASFPGDIAYNRPTGNWKAKSPGLFDVTGVNPGDAAVDTPKHKAMKMYSANRQAAHDITGIDPETGRLQYQDYSVDNLMNIPEEDYIRPGTINTSDLYKFYEMIMPGVGEGQAKELQGKIDRGRASEYYDPDWYLGRDTTRTARTPEEVKARTLESLGYIPKNYSPSPELGTRATGIDWASPELGKDRDSYESTYADGRLGSVGSGAGSALIADKYWDGSNYVSSPAETAANAAAGVAPADLLGQVGKSYMPEYADDGRPMHGTRITDVAHGGTPMVGNVSPEGAYYSRLLGPRSEEIGLGGDRRYNEGRQWGHDFSSILSPTAAALQAELAPRTPAVIPEKWRRDPIAEVPMNRSYGLTYHG